PAYSHDGAFVWADYNPSSLEFHSTSGNEFAARATGGVRFVTAIALTRATHLAARARGGVRFVTAIDFTGAPTWTCGVSAGSGGSWGCSSDRDLKAGLVPMDGIEVLDRLSGPPIYRSVV